MLAEKVYSVDDLGAALNACGIQGEEVGEGTVTLGGEKYMGSARQCVVEEMGAPSLARTEFGNQDRVPPDGGEYSWSNVRMVWEQTDGGRDVTITVK